MPKYSFQDELKNQEVVENSTPVTINKTQKIESLLDAHLEYTGQVTGKSYAWHKAGDIQLVDEADAHELLAKRLGQKMCCGDGDNRIFQIVQ